MENQDEVLGVLKDFEKTPSKDFPPVLEDYFRSVAKTGKTLFPWQHLKTAFIQKVEQVMEQFNKEDPCERLKPVPNVENTKFEEMRQRIIDAMHRFTGAPFTVQRICELVTQPKKHYTQCDKFMRGIEKNVMVVSTVDPAGRKIVSESRALVNGVDGSESNGLNAEPSEENDITDGKPFGLGPEVDWAGNNVATVWPTSATPTAADADNKNNSNSATETDSKLHEKVKSEKELDEHLPDDSKVESKEDREVNDLVVKDSAPMKSAAKVSSADSEASLESSSKLTDSSEDAVKEQDSEKDYHEEDVQSADNRSDDSTSNTDAINTPVPAKHPPDMSSAEDEPPEKKQKVECTEEQETNTEVPAETDETGEESGQSEVPDKVEEDRLEEPQSANDLEKDKAEMSEDKEDQTITDEATTVDKQETDSKTMEDTQPECSLRENESEKPDQPENSLQTSMQSDNTDEVEQYTEESSQREVNENSCDSTGFAAPSMEDDDGADVGATDGEVMDTDTNSESTQNSKDLQQSKVDSTEHTSVDDGEPMEQE